MKPAVLADLELRHLAALRAVADEGTFGRAAMRLGFTQSAVSQQIAALERVVGEPVFDRPGGPRPVTLTPAGRLLLRHANAILERVRAAEADLEGLRTASGGRLAVGIFQSVSVRLVPKVLSEMRRRRPGVDFVLFESDHEDELMERLRQGELDLSFTVSMAEGEFVTTHLFDDPFLVVCPLDSDLVPARGPVPLHRLAEVPLVGQPVTACQLQVERGLAGFGVHTDIVFRSTDNGAVQAMVAAGVGHAVMPRLSLDLADPSVIIRETDPPLTPRSIGLARVAGRTLPPIADEFVAVTKESCAPLCAPKPATRRSRATSPAA